MARAGLRALEFYDPATKKHGQAHMQARCVPDIFVQKTIVILNIPCGLKNQARYYAAPYPFWNRSLGGSERCQWRSAKCLRSGKHTLK